MTTKQVKYHNGYHIYLDHIRHLLTSYSLRHLHTITTYEWKDIRLASELSDILQSVPDYRDIHPLILHALRHYPEKDIKHYISQIRRDNLSLIQLRRQLRRDKQHKHVASLVKVNPKYKRGWLSLRIKY